MHLLAVGALFAGLMQGGGEAADPPCPPRPQPMPSAIDSLGELPVPAANVIAFAAVPWEYPGRAWVVRLSRRGPEARLEIVRLLRRNDCNVYRLERRWEAPVPAADYDAVARDVSAWAPPPPGSFPSRDRQGIPAGLALDGTGIELRLSASGWEVRRTLNHYGQGGAGLSATFRALVVRLVPADELPARDWRTRGTD